MSLLKRSQRHPKPSNRSSRANQTAISMQVRGARASMPQWAPLNNPADINYGLLLPILFHCVDDQGRPMLGPPKKGANTAQFRQTAHKYIPAAVEEMRQYWMPTRFKTRS